MNYVKKYNIRLEPTVQQTLGQHEKKSFKKLVTPENAHLANDEALSLLSQMLTYDHVNFIAN